MPPSPPPQPTPLFLTVSFDAFLCALRVSLNLSFCPSTSDGFSHIWKLYHDISYHAIPYYAAGLIFRDPKQWVLKLHVASLKHFVGTIGERCRCFFFGGGQSNLKCSFAPYLSLAFFFFMIKKLRVHFKGKITFEVITESQQRNLSWRKLSTT